MIDAPGPSSLRRRTRLRAGALVLALGLVATACSGSAGDGASDGDGGEATADATTTTTSATAEAYEGDDFYAVPDPLPDAPHGTLIRYEVMDDYGFDDATTYKIMYLSESLQGEPIVVTGMASVPTAPAPEGGRPMLTISHGTTGIADECAPSKNPRPTEMSLAGNALADQVLIAYTDNEGLGTPGRHPYLVGESEARSALDAIVAAGQLPDADPGDRLAIAGYSQGGHGALWTSQLAAEWTPELEVVGTFAGAPASEIGVILAAAGRVKGFALMVMAGINAAYPEADLSTVLTPKGLEVIESVDTGCAAGVFEAAADLDASDLFVSGGQDEAPWAELGAAQDAGQEKTNDAPTLIIRSKEDTTVPAFFVEQVVDRMCANDQVVQVIELDEGGHTEAAVPSYEQATEWLMARFAGDDADATVPVVDSCAER